MTKTGSKILHGMLLATSAMVASPVIISTAAMANPGGGSVAVGSATITNPSATQTVINQSSKRALINWNSFSIQPGASVTFNQPNSKSLTVNRVTGPSSSIIDGSIFANGNIWLLNANGILFGKGSQIDVGSLLATTSELSDTDFKAANNNFTVSPDPNASVINQGTITASRDGSVVLSAPSVSNEGMIQANLGTVVLGGAQAFTVDMTGDNLLRYEIVAPVTQTPANGQGSPALALVSNSGTISATGGHVVMTARAAQTVQDNVINSTGMVEATSVSAHDGEIDLDAGPDGTANVGGTLDASGVGASQTGGTVTVTGGTVNVADGAKINASGNAGGGTVLIGGGPHGSGTLARAQRTIIGAAAINADATGNGNGGNVTVWSDGTTQFSGAISARGGAQGGNGGQVETSGQNLGVGSSARVDTTAPFGLTGDWLLDPVNIVINGCGSDAVNSTNSCVTISNSTIETALGSSNVTLEATSNINVSTNASIIWNSNETLSLLSQGNISIRSSIQNSGTGDLNIVAGWDGSTGVTGSHNGAQSVDVNTITANSAFGGSCGSISINSSVAIGSGGGVTTLAADDITLGSCGTVNIQIGYNGSGGGNVVIDTIGNLTLNGSGDKFLIGNGGIGPNVGSPVTGDVSIEVGGNLMLNASSCGTIQIGDAVIGGCLSSTVSGNTNIDVADVTTLNNSSGNITIGPSSFSGYSGNVTVITGLVSELATSLENNLISDLSNGDVFFGDDSSYTYSSGNASFSSTHNFTLASKNSLNIDQSIQNSSNGSVTLLGGWDGTTTNPSQFTNNGVYGTSNTDVTLVAGVAVGSAQGTTIVAGYDVELGQESPGTERIGYVGAGTGNINILTADSLYFITNGMGIIGNGAGTGTVGGNITLDIANTIAYGAHATIAIGNSGGAETTAGDLSITIGILNLPNINDIVDTDIGYGNVSIEYTNQTNTELGFLNYNSAHNLTLIGTGNLNLTDAITNCGTGSISISAGGTETNTAGNLTITGAVTTAGESGVDDDDVFQAGDSIAIHNAVNVGAGELILWAGQQEGDNHAGAILDPVGNVLTADTIYLRNDKGGTSDQTIGTSTAPIYVDTNHLAIATADDDIYVSAVGDVDIGDGSYGINGNNVTLTGSGSITQNSGESLGIVANGILSVTVTGDSSGIALNAAGVSGNQITGAILLNSPGDASLTNTVDTIIGVHETPDDVPENFVVGGNLTITVTNDNAANNLGGGNSTLTLEGRIHANGSGDTTLQAVGDINNDGNGDGTIYANNLNLISGNGSIGAGNWSFGLGAAGSGPVNLHISAPNGDATINPGALNIGTDQGGVTVGGNFWMLSNGVITQNANGSGIVSAGSLTVNALIGSDVVLNNSGNDVSDDVTFHTTGNITFDNSVPTVIGAINGGNATTSAGNVIIIVTRGTLSQEIGSGINAATLTVSADEGITLNSPNNNVTGTFSAISSGEIAFTNSGTITLGEMNGGLEYVGPCGSTPAHYETAYAGDVTIIAANGGIDIAGNVLSLGGCATISLTASGDITQVHNDDLDGHNFVVSSIAGNITLLNNNDLDGTVNISASGDVAFGNNDNTTLGATSVGGSLSVLSEDNLNITSNISNSGTGNILLVAGWDGTTYTPSALTNSGVYGNNNGSVTIGGTGGVYVGSVGGPVNVAGANITLNGANGAAQIGYKGSGSGNVTVLASQNVLMEAGSCGDCYVQIGDGTVRMGAISESADVTVHALGNITLDAGGEAYAYAQIGNGGDSSFGTFGGDINVTSGGNLSLTGSEDYAQIGNAGWGVYGDASGNINVNVTGNLTMEGGGNDAYGYAQIGHGGQAASGNDTGDITVMAGGSILLENPQNGIEVQIGHGGQGASGNYTGNISVTAGGLITLDPGEDALYVQIGHGGGQSALDSAAGNVTVNAAALTLTGAPGFSGDDNVEIGNTAVGNGSAASGNIAVTVSGNATITSAEGGGEVWIGNQNVGGAGSAAGAVSIVAADFHTGNDDDNDFAGFVGADLLGGDVTLGATNGSAYQSLGGFDYSSSYDLTLLTAGSMNIVGDVQNAGTGNITVVTGWNPAVSPANVSTTAGAYGNDAATLTIGGSESSSFASLGSASGTTDVLTGNLVVDAENGRAQLGYRGNGGGAIIVSALDDVLVQTATGHFAQIGNGGVNFSGDIGGDITIGAGGNITLTSGGENGITGIGNIGGTNSSQSGNITVTASNGTLAINSSGGDSFARLGNWADQDTIGTSSGDIVVNTSAISMIAAGENAFAEIGNGDFHAGNNTGAISGDITIGTGALSMAADDSNGYSQARIGNLGFGSAGGNLTLNVTGNILVSAANGALVNIGNVGNAGEAVAPSSGDLLVQSGGSISLLVVNGGDARIETGGAQTGTVTVNAGGDILLQTSGTDPGDDSLAMIGAISGNTGSETISVSSANGNISLLAGAAESLAEIGGGLAVSTSAATDNVTVSAANGSVNLAANGTDAGALIGTAVPGVGNVTVTADALTISGSGQISGDSANITLTGADQDVANITSPLLLTVNDLAIQTNNGSAYLSSPAQGLSIGVGASGINLGTGSLMLSADGDVTQTEAIDASSLNVWTSNGSSVLTNAGNTFATASISSSNDAFLTDSTGVTIANANVTGNLTLTARSIDQTGAINAGVLTATASNGGILLANTGNAIGVASLSSSADTSLTDSTGLTIAGATVDSNLNLNAASINQTGAITAANLGVEASNGSIALTNAGNIITNALLNSSGDTSLTDSGNLTVTGASVGGNLTLAAASIGQTGAIRATNLTAAASNGGIVLTNASNSVTAASLTSTGDASLTDSTALTVAGASVGGNLTLAAASIGQTGAINANALAASASNGSIALTNTGNNFTVASLFAAGDASLTDSTGLTITNATAGGNLTLAAASIGQTGAINANALAAAASNGGIVLTNASNSVTAASLTSTGDASLTDSTALTVAGASVGGNLTLAAASIGQTGAIRATNLTAAASNGGIVLTNASNSVTAASLTSTGDASLTDSTALTVAGASVGGNLTLAAASIGQTGAINANALAASASNGSIALTNTGNNFTVASLFAAGDASLTDSTGLTITNATAGGNLTLAAASIGQTGAINANALAAAASNGGIVLTNASNSVTAASLTSTGDASLTDSTALTVAGASVGGNLTLAAASIGQTGAIRATNLTAAASNGGIVLTNASNSVTAASLTSTGDASLTDSTALTVAGASVGGNLTLAAASIGQTGAIRATNLTAAASNGGIVLTNASNSVTAASLTSTGDASLTDSTALTVAGASVGGNLTLAAASIGQTGAIRATNLTAAASNGGIVLTNASNSVTAASLTSTGDASLTDAGNLTITSASVGGNLTLLTEGDLDFTSSVQLTNGSILAIAGWDGTTTSSSALNSGSAYGNNGGNITIDGGSSGVAVGSQSGSTVLAADDLILSAINGYIQVGYHGGGSGAITVNATGNVTLNGGGGTAYFAQIGDGGYQVSGSNSNAISVLANGNVTLHAGSGQEAYAQIGNGGAESNSNSSGYTNNGAVTVHGNAVALTAGSGSASYAQIGDGGYKSGQSLNGVAQIGNDIVIAAVSGVTLNGNAADAYAQIGNGGDFINTGRPNGSSGTIGGNITVTVSSPATAGNAVVGIAGSGANSYVQIGNGGNGENTTDSGNTVTYNIAGNITVNDLVLTGSNTGSNGYAQVGNGDGSHSGTGNVSGDITISQGTVFDLTPGTAPGTSTGIQNGTGTGSVSGTISGYPAQTTTPASDPTTAGSVSTIIQNNTTPTSFTYTATSSAPSFSGPTSDFTAGDSVSTAPTPLEKLAGDAEDENVPSDGVANSVGGSLNGGNAHVVSKTIIPGVLDEIITLTPTHPQGVPPADEDYSSWGNEALWRW